MRDGRRPPNPVSQAVGFATMRLKIRHLNKGIRAFWYSGDRPEKIGKKVLTPRASRYTFRSAIQEG